MADVYRNATLTVAASSAIDPNLSLYSDRWGYDKLRKVVNSQDLDTNRLHARIHYPLAGVTIKHKEETYFIGPTEFRSHGMIHVGIGEVAETKYDAPLLARAWASQARLLSPRTLHVHASEMTWECKTYFRCECGEVDGVSSKTSNFLQQTSTL